MLPSWPGSMCPLASCRSTGAVSSGPRASRNGSDFPGAGRRALWTKDDTDLPDRLRKALAQGEPADQVDALVQKLRAQRLDPLASHLAGVQRLFIAAVDFMAGLPVEVLTDQYTISYMPSGTHLTHLHDRPPTRRHRPAGRWRSGFPPTKEKPQSTPYPRADCYSAGGTRQQRRPGPPAAWRCAGGLC